MAISPCDRIRELERQLQACEHMLRSVSALLMALGSGLDLPPSACVMAAKKIRDVLDPRRGMAGPR
jgi:hypothetical protein